MADKTQKREEFLQEGSITAENTKNFPRINLRCDGEKSKHFLVKCKKCPEVSVYNVSLNLDQLIVQFYTESL